MDPRLRGAFELSHQTVKGGFVSTYDSIYIILSFNWGFKLLSDTDLWHEAASWSSVNDQKENKSDLVT